MYSINQFNNDRKPSVLMLRLTINKVRLIVLLQIHWCNWCQYYYIIKCFKTSCFNQSGRNPNHPYHADSFGCTIEKRLNWYWLQYFQRSTTILAKILADFYMWSALTDSASQKLSYHDSQVWTDLFYYQSSHNSQHFLELHFYGEMTTESHEGLRMHWWRRCQLTSGKYLEMVNRF